ncbi:MAG: MCE family protein [Planctomycetes bacterium]|nr:MCE family protein [Planctomycetota bacterium]
MADRALLFRVGLLVCGITVVFSGLMLFIVGSAMNSVTATYLVRFAENVKGMVVGSKVNFQGVPIGSVSDIRFVAGETEVELRVDPRKAEIQDVTTARIDRLLVTGQVTIELEGFDRAGKRLPSGATIPSKDDPINALKLSLPEIVQRLESTLANVDRLVVAATQFAGPENRAHVANMLTNFEDMSERIPARIDAVLDAAQTDLEALPTLVSEVRALVANADRAVDAGAQLLTGDEARRVVASARDAMDGLVSLEKRFDSFVREGSALLAAVRSPLQSAVLTARDSFREIRGLARKLRLAPSSLVFGEEATEIEIPATAPGGTR